MTKIIIMTPIVNLLQEHVLLLKLASQQIILTQYPPKCLYLQTIKIKRLPH